MTTDASGRRKRGGAAAGPLNAEGPLPDPTPSDGPDPYGEPRAQPSWMSIDWRECARTLGLDGHASDFVEAGAA